MTRNDPGGTPSAAEQLRRQNEKRRYEHEAAADIFLAPGGGGFILWARRDELLPRVSARLAAPVGGEEIVSLLICLEIGLERIIEDAARRWGCEPAMVREMMKAARPIIEGADRELGQSYTERSSTKGRPDGPRSE